RSRRGRRRADDRRRTVLPATLIGGGLLLHFHLHAAGTERELDAPAGGHELHDDAVLILHRKGTTAAPHRRARGRRRVVAVEVLDRLQVVNAAARGDLAPADRTPVDPG